MKRPLYPLTTEPKFMPEHSHTGLWFDKFCNQWCRDPEKTGPSQWTLAALSTVRGKQREDVNPKLEWIKTVANGTIGNAQLLAEHAARLADLARILGGISRRFKTTNRFASGLGREHPIENGFVWHPVLGVPYLPGSSVKGLVRAWAATWAEPAPNREDLDRILGAPDGAGTVLFLDALPLTPIQLQADIMNPHYSDYYQGKKDRNGNPTPPADWLSPTPIPFLAVAPDQLFQFALLPAAPDAKKDCTTALQWLTDALALLGAGAKTAVGYGRFEKAETSVSPHGQSSALLQPATDCPGGPRYKTGQRVRARRVEDPKGKGRPWFEADDGFGGVIVSGTPPNIQIGESIELEIANLNQGGYNFRIPGTKPPKTHKTTKQKPG